MLARGRRGTAQAAHIHISFAILRRPAKWCAGMFDIPLVVHCACHGAARI
jgi:hypothetical protein